MVKVDDYFFQREIALIFEGRKKRQEAEQGIGTDSIAVTEDCCRLSWLTGLFPYCDDSRCSSLLVPLHIITISVFLLVAEVWSS